MNSGRYYASKYWLPALTLTLVLVCLQPSLSRINEPFTGHHLGGLNSRQGVFNQNFIDHGYLALRFGIVDGYMPDARCPKDYYILHPPFHALIPSFAALLFGNTEPVIRSVPLAFFLINLILVYLISRFAFSKRTGCLVVTVYSLLPVNRIYNTLSDQYGPPFFTYTLLITYLLLIHKQKGGAYLKLALATHILSILHDWLSIINAVIILAYLIFFSLNNKSHLYKGLFFLVFSTSIGFTLNFAHLYALTGRIWVNELAGQILYRSSRDWWLFLTPLFFDGLKRAFGGVTLVLFACGIGLSFNQDSRNLKFIILSQTLYCTIFYSLYRGGMPIHFFLYSFFAFITAFVSGVSLEKIHDKSAIIFVLALLLVSSQAVISRFMADELAQERITHHKKHYLSAYTFIRYHSASMPGNKTLVISPDPGYYVGEYYLARQGYCLRRSDHRPDYKKLGYEHLVTLDINSETPEIHTP
jgi:hypothetical protein